MAKFANSVLFTPAAGGTVDFAVSAAVQGFMMPAQAGAPDGVYKYRAESNDLSQWEVGEGTYTGSGTPTLTRTTVLQNSAGTTAKINFTAAPNVGIVALKQDILSIEEANAWTYLQKAQGRANLDVLKKNYIVNGAMMVSQENPLKTLAVVNGGWPVDQFALVHTASGSLSVSQVASVTPGGSPNRIRVTVTNADASVAAGDLLGIYQRIEGLRVADLKLGSASAKTVTLQFGVKAPAGTYCVALRNGTPNRSYIAEYTISGGEANTDVVKSVTIALDQSGTWAIDNTIGLDVWFGLMCGSTYQTSPNAWTAGSFVGSSNQFNFEGTNGNVFELFDVGLYEGAAAPQFQVPDYPSELLLCQRYFYVLNAPFAGSPVFMAAGLNSTSGMSSWTFPVVMRTVPSVAGTGSGAFRYNGAASAAISSFAFSGTSTQSTRVIGTVSSGLMGGNSYDVESAAGGGAFTANARM